MEIGENDDDETDSAVIRVRLHAKRIGVEVDEIGVRLRASVTKNRQLRSGWEEEMDQVQSSATECDV